MPPRNEEGGGSLTAADITLLREMMLEVAAETAARHICRFRDIRDSDAEEMGHAVGMITDVGSGEIRAGIELIRENHKWVQRIRGRMDQAGVAAALAALGVVISATLAAFWIGFKNTVIKP
jgi:hypothetical protein